VLASSFDAGAGDRFNVIFYRNGGLTPSNLQIVDNAINAYMQDNSVPGLSLAISRNGELVYAKGFGQADQGANEWTHPNHRFRIASVSKTLTAAAASARGLLRTRSRPGRLRKRRDPGNSFGTPPYSAREQAITTRHLLQHITGWTTTASGRWAAPTRMRSLTGNLTITSRQPARHVLSIT